MNPYITPGLGLDEAGIINLITREFEFSDTGWVRSKCRETNVKIARQLLWTCLMDHLAYSQREAAMISLKVGTSARHGKIQIMDVFWNDPQYGERIRVVYNRCIEIKRRMLETKIKTIL